MFEDGAVCSFRRVRKGHLFAHTDTDPATHVDMLCILKLSSTLGQQRELELDV